jgi:hypothetical protein
MALSICDKRGAHRSREPRRPNWGCWCLDSTRWECSRRAPIRCRLGRRRNSHRGQPLVAIQGLGVRQIIHGQDVAPGQVDHGAVWGLGHGEPARKHLHVMGAASGHACEGNDGQRNDEADLNMQGEPAPKSLVYTYRPTNGRELLLGPSDPFQRCRCVRANHWVVVVGSLS